MPRAVRSWMCFWLSAMGVLGYVMVKLGLSRVALMLAFVTGPILESSFKQTLALPGGDPGFVLGRPIAMTIVVLTVIVVFAPPLVRYYLRAKGDRPLIHT